MVVSRVCDGRVVVFCCVRWYGGRQVWRIMLSPANGTPFPFRPLHAWPAGCWPACVWSVYECFVAAAAVWLVHGCVSRLMVGLFVVESFLLLPALSRPGLNSVLRVKARASCCGLGLVVAGMLDAGFLVLRPGCSRRVVFVRHRRSRTRAACWGLRCCPHWFGRLCVGPVWVCGSCVVTSITRGRFCCLMAGLSCCRVCSAIGGQLRLFW